MKLSEIRGLVLSQSDHLGSYLKMLSVLRKERRWKLIDSHCQIYKVKLPALVLLSQLKILWSKGSKKIVLNSLEIINKLLLSKNNLECNEYLKDLNEEIKKIFNS